MSTDNSLLVRYLCTDCGKFATAVYDLTQIFWDADAEDKTSVEVDMGRDEELYIAGK